MNRSLPPAIVRAILQLTQTIAIALETDVCNADALIPELQNDLTRAVSEVLTDYETAALDRFADDECDADMAAHLDAVEQDYDDHNFGNAAF